MNAPMNAPQIHPTCDALLDLVDGRELDVCARSLHAHVDGCALCGERLRLLADQSRLLRQLAAGGRSGPWRGSSCLERVHRQARQQWLALARQLTLASVREACAPTSDRVLAEALGRLPPTPPATELRAMLSQLTRRLGSAPRRGQRPPAECDGLLRWLRQVDGPGPWWHLVSALRLRGRGRHTGSVRLARRARAAAALAEASGVDAGIIARVASSLLPGATRRRMHDDQWPRATPSSRDSLAPR